MLPSRTEDPTCPMPEANVMRISFALDHFLAFPITANGIQWSGARLCRKAMESVDASNKKYPLVISYPYRYLLY